jgi:hypothetical protein
MEEYLLQMLFKRFNDSYFSGLLPTYFVKNVRDLTDNGVCYDNMSMIAINIFLPKAVTIRTLLHEMCHMAVLYIDKESGVHNCHWKKWMKKVGLPLYQDREGEKVRVYIENRVVDGIIRSMGDFRYSVETGEGINDRFRYGDEKEKVMHEVDRDVVFFKDDNI